MERLRHGRIESVRKTGVGKRDSFATENPGSHTSLLGHGWHLEIHIEANHDALSSRKLCYQGSLTVYVFPDAADDHDGQEFIAKDEAC